MTWFTPSVSGSKENETHLITHQDIVNLNKIFGNTTVTCSFTVQTK